MFEVRIDTAALRSFVVRVRSIGGRMLGSGVLVAPGRVLTCAHVVSGFDDVLIQGIGLRRISGTVSDGELATVVVRSAPPVREGGLWPYPDLALLRVRSSGLLHPVAPMESALGDERGGLLTDDRVTAWGFPRREEGVDPPGSPASFVIEGVEGDDFITVKAGQVQPGLSGAPVVCPRTRTVVGLMSATREASSALGGYVSPVGALTEPSFFRSSTEDPTALLNDILAANRAASLQNRSPWLAVLRMTGGDRLVERPWTTFRKTARSDPADLLRADFGVVRYLFRDEELEQQRWEWCESAEPLGVLLVRGAGGSGKTRFAIQLCQEMEGRGWLSGWLPRMDDTVLTAPVPRLLVIDYVEATDPQRLAWVLMQLEATATTLAPARLVLLTRTRVGGMSDPLDALTETATARVKQIAASGAETARVTRALDITQRNALYKEAATAFASAWETPFAAAQPDLSDEAYRLPLEVLFEALDRMLSGGTSTVAPGTSPVHRVFAHEQRYWRRMLPDVDPPLLDWTAAAATMAGAETEDEAQVLLAAHPDLAADSRHELRERLIRWWSELVPGGQRLNPLRPDRLGEYTAGQVLVGLGELAAPVLDKILTLSSDRQATATLDLLARTQSLKPAIERLTSDGLSAHFVSLVDRAWRAARTSASGRVDRSMADAVLRLLSQSRLHGLVPDIDLADRHPARQRDVAIACTRISDLAATSGRVNEARSLSNIARQIFQKLVTSVPEHPQLRCDLAMVHLRLADLDRAAGLPDQARVGYRRYLEEMWELTQLDPGNLPYQREMAVSHARMADLDRAAGRLERARAGYRQYLNAMRELVRLQPDNPDYQRGVAVGYGRLADLDQAARLPDQARAGYRRYLDGMRDLVLLEPDNLDYQRGVVIGHGRLGNLDRLRHPERARARYRRYLEGMQRLVQLDPDNPDYRRGVAVGHGHLADLDMDAGLMPQAREGYRRYLDGMRRLVQLNPDNLEYRREVAVGHGRLADLDRAARHVEQARAGYRRYVSGMRELTRLDPYDLGYRRELALARLLLKRVTAEREA